MSSENSDHSNNYVYKYGRKAWGKLYKNLQMAKWYKKRVSAHILMNQLENLVWKYVFENNFYDRQFSREDRDSKNFVILYYEISENGKKLSS